MTSLSTTVPLALIKAVVYCYDIITFPIYLLAQKPWARRRESAQRRARQLDPSGPYSPWVRALKHQVPDTHFVNACHTVDELWARAVREYGDRQCVGYRRVLAESDDRQPDGKVFRKRLLDDYRFLSYVEVDELVGVAANGLLALGVRPGDLVVIFAETRYEWMVSAQALWRIGATVGALYATLTDEAVVHGMCEMEVTHVITSVDLLTKLARVVDQVPSIKSMIYMEGPTEPDLAKLFPTQHNIRFTPFAEVLSLGADSQHVSGADHKPQADDTAVVMYTSGSTGRPKGVIITHSNIMAGIRAYFPIAQTFTRRDVYIAYLPLAHVYELMCELFVSAFGMPIGYGSPYSLTDRSTGLKPGCRGDAVLLKPTFICVVPLVLDGIRKGVGEQVASKGLLFRAFSDFCVSYKTYWTRKGYKTPLLDRLVFAKVAALLGGRVRLMSAGGAPLSPDTHEFIRACLDVALLQGYVRLMSAGGAPLSPDTHEFIRACLDVALLQGYGMTETVAAGCAMDFADLSVGNIGPPLEGIQIKLIDWPEGHYRAIDQPHPRGEIVIGGPVVAKGYYKNPELTSESFEVDGEGVRWFRTGDIGEILDNGSVRIVDRKKDLVKLPTGEYVTLGTTESVLKACPLVDNLCCYADPLHAYLIALIVVNEKQIRALATKLHKSGDMSFRELCADGEIVGRVLKEVRDWCRKGRLPTRQIPEKVVLCAEQWAPETGLVTAAMKLQRRAIADYYRQEINTLYGIGP
ncbi:unnamed protein product, partial [Oppiella nova]